MTQSPKPLSALSAQFAEPIDLFICSASFESRCQSIAQHLDPGLITRALIARNEPFSQIIHKNFLALSDRLAGKCEALSVTSDDPVGTADSIITALSKAPIAPHGRVIIDITTFTHEVLLMLFKIGASTFLPGTAIDFVYATAAEYSVGAPPDQKWLSKGIREIRSVMGFPGRLLPSRNSHLIILGGFEEFRALALIQEFEPAIISIGHGDRTERSTGPHQETNETKVRRLRSLVGQVNDFVFSCYDPLSIGTTLTALVDGTPEANVIVAPMNTKVSTLGTARFAASRDGVQLCYAQPDAYNYAQYSKAGTEFYSYRFDDYPPPSASR